MSQDLERGGPQVVQEFLVGQALGSSKRLTSLGQQMAAELGTSVVPWGAVAVPLQQSSPATGTLYLPILSLTI